MTVLLTNAVPFLAKEPEVIVTAAPVNILKDIDCHVIASTSKGTSQDYRIPALQNALADLDLQALANAADAVESEGKSPMSALNERGVRVRFTVVEQSGPEHCPSFIVVVTVADMRSEGRGHSKRETRTAAACACLAAVLTCSGRMQPAPPNHQGFTSDKPPEGQDALADLDLQALANAADAVESEGKSPMSALNELGVRVRYRIVDQSGPEHCPSFIIVVTDLQALANAADAVESEGKSPMSALNELGVRVRYRIVDQSGPPHCPSFTVVVTVADMLSEGRGHTKREAQAAAASDCLVALLTRADGMQPAPSTHHDFTSDKPPEGQAANSSAGAVLFGAPVPVPAHKSPISTLYENYPELTFICTYGDGSPLDSMQGSSKKLAKLAAASAALGELQATPPRAHSLHNSPCAPPPSQLLADHVARLVNDKFNELMRGDLVHSKRKVLAGIVITINHSVEGARVAARRCLQRHLYAQLLMYASSPDPRKPIPHSDLEPLPDGGYQLKPDRQLHLYVSTAPCGDGRVFSPHEHIESEPDEHPNRLARGQLRTKIESGEGTIPTKNCNNIIQTWDGILQGERLLTMSCSDKIARWCVVGLQGALLTRLLRPVYLHTLVLGSLLHPQHLYRAIGGRIENYISSLPPSFRLQRPMMARASSTEARATVRAPSFSVCWSCTSPGGRDSERDHGQAGEWSAVAAVQADHVCEVAVLGNQTPTITSDNLKLSKVISTHLDSLLLQDDLERLVEWCNANRMRLIPKKCFDIKFTKKKKPCTTSYSLKGIMITEIGEMGDLGVMLEMKLTYVPHINRIVKNAGFLSPEAFK
ncbi:unnamed protein product [Parnassius apollo]|uniref:(apollo) hypothetical protein n=1 Tax=Parnassius apollo TaxID=110799 RepID=A0A8S3X7K7_PARAO|nr:unnamed protein product [Parnassius apollo]